MDNERAFEIVLDKLLEASTEQEKMRGERDIAKAELANAQGTICRLEGDVRSLRDITDFTSSESFQSTLKETRNFLIGLPERNMELERRLKDAIEKTDPIPF